MKILITTDWYAPQVNGVVFSLMNLKKGLTARGHEVRILTLSGSIHSTEDAETLRLGSIPMSLVYPGARVRVRPGHRIFRDLVKWQPDVIHSQCEFNSYPVAVHLSHRLGVPLIHTYHTVYEDYAEYVHISKRLSHPVVSRLSRLISFPCDYLVAPTDKVAKLLESYQINTPIAVIPTGIDLARFQQIPDQAYEKRLREKYRIPSGKRIAVYLGRLAQEKNIDELLEFFQAAEHESWIFLIVGGGPHYGALEKKAEALGLGDCVRFTGMVSPDRVPAHYHLGDLFLSASVSEAQGLTYVEALACSLPLLCRKDASLDPLIEEGVNGWQYETKEDFARCLSEYGRSRTLREQMKKAARESTASYSIEQFAQRAESIYRDAIARKAVYSQEQDNRQLPHPHQRRR